ncbi:MAG: hypothetical protein HQ546_08110 [Planctomycetes bacterium]|nr:hypothetical protein [Planctomycetota bacterium]
MSPELRNCAVAHSGASSAPLERDYQEELFIHGFREARLSAGITSPAATILRPVVAR